MIEELEHNCCSPTKLIVSSTQSVFAGGPERDYDEAYEDIPDAM
ncbi:MAG: hypothetical protein ACRD8Z_26255 [Nitrososphaeraceae archaeon]|jgi:hypothetical protein